MLEYYPGILILTTNHVGTFDEAIKSRVHCALYYPPLSKAKTSKVWRMNLEMLEERKRDANASLRLRVDHKEIKEFAADHWRTTPAQNRWNGRQIKYAFQTAIALAEWDHHVLTGDVPNPHGPLLTRAHFEQVAKASSHFDNYLNDVRRQYADIAE